MDAKLAAVRMSAVFESYGIMDAGAGPFLFGVDNVPGEVLVDGAVVALTYRQWRRWGWDLTAENLKQKGMTADEIALIHDMLPAVSALSAAWVAEPCDPPYPSVEALLEGLADGTTVGVVLDPDRW